MEDIWHHLGTPKQVDLLGCKISYITSSSIRMFCHDTVSSASLSKPRFHPGAGAIIMSGTPGSCLRAAESTPVAWRVALPRVGTLNPKLTYCFQARNLSYYNEETLLCTIYP